MSPGTSNNTDLNELSDDEIRQGLTLGMLTPEERVRWADELDLRRAERAKQPTTPTDLDALLTNFAREWEELPASVRSNVGASLVHVMTEKLAANELLIRDMEEANLPRRVALYQGASEALSMLRYLGARLAAHGDHEIEEVARTARRGEGEDDR